MFSRRWRERAETAERQLAELRESLAGIELRIQERAALIAIVRDGRINRFTFVRGETITQIETMGMLGDDFNEWKHRLLDPINKGNSDG